MGGCTGPSSHFTAYVPRLQKGFWQAFCLGGRLYRAIKPVYSLRSALAEGFWASFCTHWEAVLDDQASLQPTFRACGRLFSKLWGSLSGCTGSSSQFTAYCPRLQKAFGQAFRLAVRLYRNIKPVYSLLPAPAGHGTGSAAPYRTFFTPGIFLRSQTAAQDTANTASDRPSTIRRPPCA